MNPSASVTTYEMRTLIPALFLAPAVLSAPTFAQPAPTTCSVTIMRAPEQVRATVEQWLAKETCTLALQVRIVPTEGGLYLLATDEHGRVRERIVPDAASAGVLIASWAADDGLGGAAPPAQPQPVQPIAPPPVVYAQPQYPYQAGAAAVPAFGPGAFHPNAHPEKDDDDDDDETPPPKPTYPQKYFSIGGSFFGTNYSRGLRAELDLANWGGWTLAAVGAFNTPLQVSENYDSSGYTQYSAHIYDYVVALDFGHIWHLGNWHVRAAIGAGLVYSTMTLYQDSYTQSTETSGTGSMTSPYIETGVMVGYSFGQHEQWAIEVGPELSYTQQQWYLADSMTTMTRDGGLAAFVASVRHGL